MDQRNNLLALLSFIQCNLSMDIIGHTLLRSVPLDSGGKFPAILDWRLLQVTGCVKHEKEKKKFSTWFRLRLVTSFSLLPHPIDIIILGRGGGFTTKKMAGKQMRPYRRTDTKLW